MMREKYWRGGMIDCKYDEGKVRLHFRVYDEDLKNFVSSLVSSSWDLDRKEWVLSLEDYCIFKRGIDWEGVLREGEELKEELVAYKEDRKEVMESKLCSDYYLIGCRLEPYKHQRQSFNFLSLVGSGLLFDEMRLGKTKVNIDLFLYWRARKLVKRCLVLCPKAVVLVWVDELRKNIGSGYDNYTTVFNLREKKSLDEGEFVIVNYEYFRENANDFRDKFDFIILDEGHRIKNRDSKISKAVLSNLGDVRFRIVSTGTPFEKVEQLWPLLYFVRKEDYGSYWKFVNRYCIQEKQKVWVKGGGQRVINTIVGYKNQEELNDKLSLVSIRRKVEDCYDLPERIFETLWVELIEKEKEEYDKCSRDFYDSKTNEERKKSLVRMQMAISSISSNGSEEYISSKIDTLEEFLEDLNLVSSSQKVVVWSSYIQTIELLGERLKKYNPLLLYGETSNKSFDIVKKFNEDVSCKVLVSNPAVGGLGINLSASDIMIYLDCPISYTNYLQSLDRNRSIEKKKSCLVVYLKVKNTVDDWLTESYEKKQSLYQFVLGDESNVGRDWEGKRSEGE